MNGFFYRNTAKDARTLYRNLGVPQFRFFTLFSIVRDLLFFPLMGKVWGIALKTTPEGYISNSNVVMTIEKSPWIVLIGIALIVIYALLAIWQSTAILTGISYARNGQKIRLSDLISISIRQTLRQLRLKNLMILPYSLIIVPLANAYQTNMMIQSFIVPEYVQNFVLEQPVLFAVSMVIMLCFVYLALRWFFILPGFVLKGNSFNEARKESKRLTTKSWLTNGINSLLYNLAELFRLSIIPLILVMLPVTVCFIFTKGIENASNLFSIIGVSVGFQLVKSITGSFVQLSTMCFVTELYFLRLEECGLDTDVILPELRKTYTRNKTVRRTQTTIQVAAATLLAAGYMAAVFVAEKDSSILLKALNGTAIIAHRGYSSIAPENTLPAFEMADECDKVDYIELDVRSTKDGVPVVIQNESIKSATGIDRSIYDISYEELQEIPASYHFQTEQFPYARIPSLESVIAKYADSTPLLIEILDYERDKELTAKVVELLKEYECDDYCMVQSEDYKALVSVKQLDSDIRCGLVMAAVTGNFYDLPYADFFTLEHSFVNSSTVSTLHSHGKKVFAWTVNYPKSAGALCLTGVDGLITDYPEYIELYVADTNNLIRNVVHKQLDRLDGMAIKTR